MQNKRFTTNIISKLQKLAMQYKIQSFEIFIKQLQL